MWKLNQLKLELKAKSLISSSDDITTNITSRIYGTKTLIEEYPDVHKEMVKKYKAIMALSLENQIYKVNNDVSSLIGSLAETLGFYLAGPRDVVDIHFATMKDSLLTEEDMEKRNVYKHEGWLIVLELMGNLTSFYRKRAQGRHSLFYEGEKGNTISYNKENNNE